MTYESQSSKSQYAGNGAATSFPTGFKFLKNSHVHAVLTVNGVDEALVEGTDYSLTGAGVESGGSVVYPATGSARHVLAVGERLSIYLAPPIAQDKALSQATVVDLREIEQGLDMLTMTCQALDEKIARSLKYPMGTPAEEVGKPDEYLNSLQTARSAAETAATASASARTGAETARAGAEAARDAAASSAASLELQTIMGSIAAVETGLMSLAMKQAVQAGDTDRSILMNGWLDPLTDADDVTLTDAVIDSGAISNAGAENHVTALDLTTAQFLNEKGNITTLTIDTPGRSGHFDAAKGSRVVAGCRMVIAGTSYVITKVTGDGTATDSVVFDSNSLTAGPYTISGIYGLTGSATIALPSGSHPNIPVMTGYGPQNGVTVSGSSYSASFYPWYAFDDAASGNAWLSNGNTNQWLKVDFGANKTVHRYMLHPGGIGQVARGPNTWTLQGSATGAFSGEQVTIDSRSGITWNGSEQYFDVATPGAYRYYRLYVNSNNGDGLYVQLLNCQLYTTVTPASTIYPASMSVYCKDWVALKALARTETLNSQSIWYALSFDGGTTYSAFVSSAWLPIVRNNAGAWEYWSGSAWTNATPNSALGAMAQAAGVTGNRMTGATMAGLSQAQIEGSGGFTGGQTSLPVLAALYSGSSTATPVLSAMSMTSDIQPHDMVAEFSAFEAVDPDIGRAVFVMQAVDDITLDTDVKAWMKRGTGAYAQVPLVQDSAYDATRVLVRGELDMSATPGTAAQLKLTTHNNKAVKVFQASNYFKSKA
mgnify:CR=1 FL=1